jgi:hypothetical protein
LRRMMQVLAGRAFSCFVHNAETGNLNSLVRLPDHGSE